MLTIPAFIVALGLLVAIHEYGHFQVARWCGVKVLRFAIGFGKPLLRWRGKNQDTEFALCLLPLGGYVKMLDEREGAVDAAERHLAFNTQPVWKRFLIVAAGPVANLLLAIAIYTGMAWYGVQQAQPIVAEPPAHSLAAQAGLRSGDRVVGWRMTADADWQTPASLDQLSWHVMQAALDKRDVALLVQSTLVQSTLVSQHQAAQTGQAGQAEAVTATAPLGRERTLVLPLHQLKPGQEASEGLGQAIGIGRAWLAPVIYQVLPAGAAARGGLQDKDRVLSINQQPIYDAAHLQSMIQQDLSGKPQLWQVQRAGQVLQLHISPVVETDNGQRIAKVGIQLGGIAASVLVRYGFFEGITQGAQKVWQLSAMSIKGFAQMVTGQLSVKNLSGPLTIADFAGRSAQAGLGAYLLFLGLISVSLGVLNLMPIPILDGGHLVYYLWEAMTGRPVSEIWDQRFKQVGLVLLGCMMAIAMFNDLSRHFR